MTETTSVLSRYLSVIPPVGNCIIVSGECDWHLQCYTDNIRGISLYNIAILDSSPPHQQDNHNLSFSKYYSREKKKYFFLLVYIKRISPLER